MTFGSQPWWMLMTATITLSSLWPCAVALHSTIVSWSGKGKVRSWVKLGRLVPLPMQPSRPAATMAVSKSNASILLLPYCPYWTGTASLNLLRNSYSSLSASAVALETCSICVKTLPGTCHRYFPGYSMAVSGGMKQLERPSDLGKGK